MLTGTLRTIRYARSWGAGAEVVSEAVEILRDGESIPATLVLPARRKGPLPGWIALGGVSRMGRFHPQLVRFSESLASSGAAVIIPEVPEWRDLEVTPRPVSATLKGCLDYLDTRCDVRDGKAGLIGFSFGAPQVAIASGLPDITDRVAGAVLFGAYCCLERTLVCQFTGKHEWDGESFELDPDPYGRYVVGANHLTDVPGHQDAVDVAEALRQLGAAASEERISAWESHHDPLIRSLRGSLPKHQRELYDLFATPRDGTRPDEAACAEMARSLAEACRRVEPLLEPAGYLHKVAVPTRLIHGRGDRLIPFTECYRLFDDLPEEVQDDRAVTGLFNHSADRTPGSAFKKAREQAMFFGTLRGLINTV